MNSQIQLETNGVRVLVYKCPVWHVKSTAYMGYLIMTVHNEKAMIGEDEMFPPDRLDKALKRVEKLPEFVDVPTKLPEGDWKFHAVTTEMTEEQAKVVVPEYKNGHNEKGHPLYDDKGNVIDEINCAFITATKSFHSLLRSHGIDPNEKHVILIERK